MRNTDTFRQYAWLVSTIQRAKEISFERIQQLWIEDELNDRKPLSRTTFHRLKLAVGDMFGIIIECDPTNEYRYYIKNREILGDNSTQTWMLQTLVVNNILIDCRAIKDRLVLEEIPAGTEYLKTIICAIKNNHALRMTHQSFEVQKAKTTILEPYCLKVFRQRWYLLGKDQQRHGQLRIYALDRVTGLEETDQEFELDVDFDANVFFKNYFGVFIGENEKPLRIVLRAYGKMIPLMRTLPKHISQKEILTTDLYSDFEYYLVPTFDFKQEILREGNELEVLEPKSLRKSIMKELNATLKRYKQK